MQDENKKSFHQGMKAELKKVIWPTGKQVVKSTFATISFVLLISIILIALNTVFSFLTEKWFDLVLEDKQIEQSVNGSGDTSVENAVISGDVASGEIVSGENNTVINSGDENSVTE